MNDNLHRLYDNLVKDGYELPAFDQFALDMQDSTKANKLHSTLSKDGYELPDFNQFYSDIYTPSGTKSPETTQIIPDQVQSQPEPTGNPLNAGMTSLFNILPKDILPNMMGSINRGITQFVPATLRLGAGLESQLGGLPTVGGINQPILDQAADVTEKFINEMNPVSDEFAQSTTGQVLQGIGQVVPLIATGGESGVAQLSEQGATLAPGLLAATGRAAAKLGTQAVSPQGILAGAMTAGPEWKAAKDAGMSDDEAFSVLIKNYAVGQTEALPIENILGKLNKLTGNSLIDAVKLMGSGGFQEGIQEGFQTYLTNKIAQGGYDPDRDPAFQLLESAKVGAIVGLLIPGVGIAMQSAPKDIQQKLTEKIITLTADGAIADSKTGDVNIDLAIDKAAELDQPQKQVIAQAVQDVSTVSPSVTEEQAQAKAKFLEQKAKDDERGFISNMIKRFRLPTLNKLTIEDVGYNPEDINDIIAANNDTHEFNSNTNYNNVREKKIEALKEIDKLEEFIGKEPGVTQKSLDKLRKIFEVEGGYFGQKQSLEQAVQDASKPTTSTITDEAPVSVQDTKQFTKTEQPQISEQPEVQTPSQLAQEFNDSGVLLGQDQDTKAEARPVLAEQVADFLRSKGIKTEEEVNSFVDEFNALPIEGKPILKVADAKRAYELLAKPKVQPFNGETVERTVNEEIKRLTDERVKGKTEGFRAGQSFKNDLVTRLQTAMKEANLRPQQVNAVLSRIRRTNAFTPGSVSKLGDFVNKVMSDADYADKLDLAYSLQGQVKQQGKSKTAKQNIKQVSKEFGKLDPQAAFENIDDYIKLANKITSNEVFDEFEVMKVVDKQKAQQAKEDLRLELGDFTDEEINDMVDEEGNLTSDLKGKEVKSKELRDKLTTQTEYAKLALESDEHVREYATNERENEILDQMLNADPSKMEVADMLEYNRTVDNILINQDFSGADRVWAKLKAIESDAQLSELDAKSQKGGRKNLGVGSTGFFTLGQAFDKLFNKNRIASEVQRIIGLTDAIFGGSTTHASVNTQLGNFGTFIKEVNKKYSKQPDIRRKEEQWKVLVLGVLARNTDGKSHLPKIKGNIERTIELYKQSDPELGKKMEEYYQPYKDVQSSDEAVALFKKNDPKIHETWKWLQDNVLTEDLTKASNQNTVNLYNQSFIPENFYFPYSQKKLLDLEGVPDPDAEQGGPVTSLRPQQAINTKSVTRSLAKGYGYNLDVFGGVFRAYQSTLMDINTSRHQLLLHEVTKRKALETLVGGKDNKDTLVKTLIERLAEQSGRARNSDSDVIKAVNDLVHSIRNIGVAIGLGGFDQIATQSFPVFIASVPHLGTDAGRMFTSIPDSFRNNVIKKTTIAEAGERHGQTSISDVSKKYLSEENQKQWLNVLDQFRRFTEKGANFKLKPLTWTDVNMRHQSFTAFYIKRLIELGVNEKNIDLKTEHTKQKDPKRKTATAWASNMVSNLQVPTNKIEMGDFWRTHGGWEIVRNIIMPFSVFPANTKNRLYRGIGKISANPTEAAKDIGSVLGESIAFSGLKTYIIGGIYIPMIESAFRAIAGVDKPDKDEASTEEDFYQGWLIDFATLKSSRRIITNLINDISPLAVGMGQNVNTELMNRLGYLMRDKEKYPEEDYPTVDEWVAETKGLVDRPYESDFSELGVLGVGVQKISDMNAAGMDAVRAGLQGDESIWYDGYYGPEQVDISDKGINELVQLNGLMEALSVPAPRELGIAWKKMYSEQMKDYTPTRAQQVKDREASKRRRRR